MSTAPYGSWESPVRIEALAGAPPLGTPDPAANGLYWTEVRPQEEGRSVLVWCERGGERVDVTPARFNVRTRVHEYGGGAFWRDGETIVFSHFLDGRLYRQDGIGAAPVAITPEPHEPNAIRYADGCTSDGRVVCVRESHGGGDVVNDVVVLAVDGSDPPTPLLGGNDFYAAPRASPDGRRLAWLTWNHPHLPFTATELWVGDFDGSDVHNAEQVAGGDDESVFQPSWDATGRLHWVSDRTGWWNLYREGENLTPMEAELGWPAWLFALSRYAFLDDGRIACAVVRNGIASLELLDPDTRELVPLDLPYTYYGPTVRAHGNRIAAVAGSGRLPAALVEIDADTGSVETYEQHPLLGDEASVSDAVPIEFPSEGGRTVHAFLYRPHNDRFEPPDGELPPLIVLAHGGPTASTVPLYEPEVQFWTSRGVAVVDVNYGGSTGYGRAYRRLLDGAWGVVDVEDVAAAARHLAAEGEGDPRRIAVAGGSAGGYTTLLAVAVRDEFAAGLNHFGVVDLETFVRDTHKFEARYVDLLVGRYPERADLYRERSPITHAGRIRASLLTFQGLDDRVVPPSQSEQLNEALKANGVPHAYLAFEGEGHGFRKRESLLRVGEASLAFLAAVFGFVPADEVPPLELD